MTELRLEEGGLEAIAAGAKSLAAIGWQPEPLEVAIALEGYRLAWKPPTVSVILLGESHIYTSAADFAIEVEQEKLPAIARQTPRNFVRIIYCLGYGESELLTQTPTPPNPGTRQFWELFGRLSDRGKPPKRSRDTTFKQRIQWKVETLETLQKRGIWVLDASFHAMYAPGGKRIPNAQKLHLHRQWWDAYGEQLITRFPQAKVWVIGKTVADDLKKLGIPFEGWIYQPGAGRRRDRDLEYSWDELSKLIDGSI